MDSKSQQAVEPSENEKSEWDQAYFGMEDVYNSVCGLDPQARDFLRQHYGLDTETCRELGVRSVHWRQWKNLIIERFDDDKLRRIGITSYFLRPDWYDPEGRRGPFEHALVYPYRGDPYGGEYISTLRFRATEPGVKTMGLRAPAADIPGGYRPPLSRDEPRIEEKPPDWVSPHRPALPFLDRYVRREREKRENEILWVVEGESDALSLHSIGRLAVATISAGTWRPHWTSSWTEFDAIVIVPDGDDGGRVFGENVVSVATNECGAESHWDTPGKSWVNDHVYVAPAPQGTDVNDLLVAGCLEEAASELEANLETKDPR